MKAKGVQRRLLCRRRSKHATAPPATTSTTTAAAGSESGASPAPSSSLQGLLEATAKVKPGRCNRLPYHVSCGGTQAPPPRVWAIVHPRGTIEIASSAPATASLRVVWGGLLATVPP